MRREQCDSHLLLLLLLLLQGAVGGLQHGDDLARLGELQRRLAELVAHPHVAACDKARDRVIDRSDAMARTLRVVSQSSTNGRRCVAGAGERDPSPRSSSRRTISTLPVRAARISGVRSLKSREPLGSTPESSSTRTTSTWQ